MSESDFDVLLNFFRALADQSRLRILGILASQDRNVEELAKTLRLKSPTVSHHLVRLRDAGLVSMKPQGTTHYYSLDASALEKLSRRLLTRRRVESLIDDVDAADWERKTLRDYFEGTRLRQIPTVRKKRETILRCLVKEFQPDVTYTQKQVNEILVQRHEDVAYLRREMIGMGLLTRDRGIYKRPATEIARP